MSVKSEMESFQAHRNTTSCRINLRNFQVLRYKLS